MAITRRQFVTRLGALAAAVGASQSDLAKVVEAWGHAAPWNSPDAWTTKPKVIWVHGAECTGCSTSLLSLLEDVRAEAVEGTGITTLAALNIIAGGDALATSASHPYAHRTLQNTNLNVEDSPYAANIADVLIDFIDLQYHETVMGMGGDLAYNTMAAERAGAGVPFVLVVEGALQDDAGADAGYWNQTTGAPWCSIGADGSVQGSYVDQPVAEHVFADTVGDLASQADCVAVIAMGQCATFGGYPACKSPVLKADDNGGTTVKQTGALGTAAWLALNAAGAETKVVNVPGCPANPWWFVVTAVLALVDLINGNLITVVGPNSNALLQVDSQGRPTAVYGHRLHGKYCPRYKYYVKRAYAANPGDPGCLKNIGCDGLSTNSACGRHGWNGRQPTNVAVHLDASGNNIDPISPAEALIETGADGTSLIGGNCLAAGAPCMGCTETGYPDKFTPFCTR